MCIYKQALLLLSSLTLGTHGINNYLILTEQCWIIAACIQLKSILNRIKFVIILLYFICIA